MSLLVNCAWLLNFGTLSLHTRGAAQRDGPALLLNVLLYSPSWWVSWWQASCEARPSCPPYPQALHDLAAVLLRLKLPQLGHGLRNGSIYRHHFSAGAVNMLKLALAKDWRWAHYGHACGGLAVVAQ